MNRCVLHRSLLSMCHTYSFSLTAQIQIFSFSRMIKLFTFYLYYVFCYTGSVPGRRRYLYLHCNQRAWKRDCIRSVSCSTWVVQTLRIMFLFLKTKVTKYWLIPRADVNVFFSKNLVASFQGRLWFRWRLRTLCYRKVPKLNSPAQPLRIQRKSKTSDCTGWRTVWKLITRWDRYSVGESN